MQTGQTDLTGRNFKQEKKTSRNSKMKQFCRTITELSGLDRIATYTTKKANMVVSYNIHDAANETNPRNKFMGGEFHRRA